MKGELPMDRQAVQVKINDGDWQPAMYQDGQFVDLYGLPLDHHKISSWRPAGGSASGAVSGSRELHGAPRVSQRAN
jgi:hypothetical protein